MHMIDRQVGESLFIARAWSCFSCLRRPRTRPSPTGRKIGSKRWRRPKEGQVTVYIYRYEGLLQDFKREYPGINVVAVTGRGNDLTNRIMAERRGGKFIADVYSGGTNSLYNTLYKGKALDPLKPLLILPEVTDTLEMVRQRTSLRRSGREIYLCLHRFAEQCPAGLQYQSGQPERIQILRRRDQSQVEGQDRLP